jgi:hypothetical protein
MQYLKQGKEVGINFGNPTLPALLHCNGNKACKNKKSFASIYGPLL